MNIIKSSDLLKSDSVKFQTSVVEEQSLSGLVWPVPNLKDGDWGYQSPRGDLEPGSEGVAKEKANSHREKICRWVRGRCRSPSGPQ